MIELAVRPLDRIVALLAGGGEASMRYRTFCILVVGLVARNARRIRDVVIVVDVAIGADPRRDHVGASQRPSRLRVIELAIRPLNGVMALLAGGRESGVRHRGLRVLVVRLVARNARRIRNVVVVVDVAINAGPRRNLVRSGQREAGLRVIELAVRPLHGVMAHFARGREPRMRHRTLGVVEIGLVT